MEFKIDFSTTRYHGDVLDTESSDIDEFTDDEDKALALFSYIVLHVLDVARDYGDNAPFDTITVEEVFGERGSTGDGVTPEGNLMEICRKLVWFHELEEYDLDKALACIEDQGWGYFDFDNKYWSECIRYQVDDKDYEEVSKQELECLGQEIDPDLADFFDHDAHGRHVAESDYETVTINGAMYLMDK